MRCTAVARILGPSTTDTAQILPDSPAFFFWSEGRTDNNQVREGNCGHSFFSVGKLDGDG